MENFEKQVRRIAANREAIAEATGHQTVQVLRPNGRHPGRMTSSTARSSPEQVLSRSALRRK
jgi:hypothetical protein